MLPTTPPRPPDVCLKIGTVNVGTMRGRCEEVVDMAARRHLDICCVQEMRWRGGRAKCVGSDDECFSVTLWRLIFKVSDEIIYWIGCEEGVSGVGVLVAGRWVGSVVEVRRVRDNVMVLRLVIGKSVLNVVSLYPPQVGRTADEKEKFYIFLRKF